MIPKILHQFWIGNNPPPMSLINTWIEKHPGWTHIFWDEKRLQDEFPNGLLNQYQYDIMPELNGKCDIARYEILYRFGGFFIDADTVCINRLDDFLFRNDSFSCYENELERGNLIAAGYLASTKDNELMRNLISDLGELSESDLLIGNVTAWITVGPRFLTKTVHKYGYNKLSVYPSYFFIPKHYTGREYLGPAKIYCTQHWGSTPGSIFEHYLISNDENSHENITNPMD